MNQKNNKFKIILGITLILAIIICSFIVENCNNNKKYTDVNLDSSKLNIFYFNVGQADCTLVTINNKNLLIDAGNKSDGEYIVEFLKKKKLNNIDYFIITHGDMDHRGGAEIISAGNNKKYNHPTKEVLQRLKDANIQEDNILITKNQGTIWITSDGKEIKIQRRDDINLDGTGQSGQMSIYEICSFFNAIEYIHLAF